MSIAQFDSNGFWYCGDIGFSLQGTLVNTLNHVITMSESGKTNSELERHFRTRVQDALRTLLNADKIARTKPANRYIYVSSDPIVSERQVQRRAEVGDRKRLPDWIIAEILIETIRSFPVQPEIDDVVKRLSKKGSLITHEQVKQVFEENNLEKNSGLIAIQLLQLCREQAEMQLNPRTIFSKIPIIHKIISPFSVKESKCETDSFYPKSSYQKIQAYSLCLGRRWTCLDRYHLGSL